MTVHYTNKQQSNACMGNKLHKQSGNMSSIADYCFPFKNIWLIHAQYCSCHDSAWWKQVKHLLGICHL